MSDEFSKKEETTKKKSILIMEDDQYIRDLYVLVLNQAGYEAVGCADGVTGMAEANKRQFDLVLLDLMMPNMSGLQFLRELKEHPPKFALGPVVVMSNLAYNDAKDEAMKLGAKDFLVKAEMEPKDILAHVESFLKPTNG